MSGNMETTAAPHNPNLLRNLIAILIIVVIIVAVGYFAYNASQQPNIQVTNLQLGSPQTSPQTSPIQNQGRVATSGSFSYTTTVNGVVYLEFDNSFSTVTTKQVSISYAAAGASQSGSFSVSAGQVYTVQVPLNNGQSVSGTFTVSGGSGNDIDFYIDQYTCSQTVSFSLVLVNSGSANGYATVVLTTDNGIQAYNNKYFVQQGQQEPVSGSAVIPDCASHTLTPSVTQAKG
jgi:hypothetical protein